MNILTSYYLLALEPQRVWSGEVTGEAFARAELAGAIRGESSHWIVPAASWDASRCVLLVRFGTSKRVDVWLRLEELAYTHRGGWHNLVCPEFLDRQHRVLSEPR